MAAPETVTDWTAAPAQDPWASVPEAVPQAGPAQGAAAGDAPPVPPGIPAVTLGPEAFATRAPQDVPERRAGLRGLLRRWEPGGREQGGREQGDRHGSPAPEPEAEAWVRAALAQPVPACRRIAVVSVRGGAGKTTLAALIGMELEAHRQDRVLVVDADPAMGSLPMRLGVAATRSLHDLAAAPSRSWEDASGYLARAGWRLWVLPGTAGGGHGGRLEFEVFRAAVDGLEGHFSASVIDCGAGVLGGLQEGILATAHAQVLVTPCTENGVTSALGALDWFAANGHEELIPRTVIALVAHTPDTEGEREGIQRALSAGGTTVIHLPYDPHLARGTAIEPVTVGAATRAAASRLAADVLTRAVGADFGPDPAPLRSGP